MAGIKVLNKARIRKGKEQASWVYIGRGKGSRGSPLGNPYSHKESDIAEKVLNVEEALTKYEEWIRGEWKKRGAVFWELARLATMYKQNNSLTLVCWCKPEPCHGDILADIIPSIADWLDEKESKNEESNN